MNKKGWGLRVELGFILLFLVCLLIATLGLNRLGIFSKSSDEIHIDSGTYDYVSIENKVTSAAKKYYSVNYPNGSNDTLVVKTDTLKSNGYLSSIKDGLGRECSGYSKILPSGTCVSYIKCSSYKTTGYDASYE